MSPSHGKRVSTIFATKYGMPGHLWPWPQQQWWGGEERERGCRASIQRQKEPQHQELADGLIPDREGVWVALGPDAESEGEPLPILDMLPETTSPPWASIPLSLWSPRHGLWQACGVSCPLQLSSTLTQLVGAALGVRVRRRGPCPTQGIAERSGRYSCSQRLCIQWGEAPLLQLQETREMLSVPGDTWQCPFKLTTASQLPGGRTAGCMLYLQRSSLGHTCCLSQLQQKEVPRKPKAIEL